MIIFSEACITNVGFFNFQDIIYFNKKLVNDRLKVSLGVIELKNSVHCPEDVKMYVDIWMNKFKVCCTP